MYAGRIRSRRNQRWELLFQRSKYSSRLQFQDYSCSPWLKGTTLVGKGNHSPNGCVNRRDIFYSFFSRGIASRNTYSGLPVSVSFLRSNQLRAYSSEGDGRNSSEDNCTPVNDGSSTDKGKTQPQTGREDVKPCDTHARLGEQDQKDWLKTEKLSIESRKKESPFLSRREKFKNEFLRRVVPWERIHVSWDTFPYYIHENTKNLLMECAVTHLKHKNSSAKYGARLASSSGRILLQSLPGTELYRERLVRALARDLQVPLLVLDSSILAPYDFSNDGSNECDESDDENVESGDECSDSEIDDENNAPNDEEWTSSNDTKTDCSDDDVVATAENALRKLVPSLEEFEKRISGESEGSDASSKPEAVESSDRTTQPLKKGDRVKYIGPDVQSKVHNRSLSSGQRGEVYEVDGDNVAVILDTSSDEKGKEEKDEKVIENSSKPPVCWLNVKDIEPDLESQAEDCYIAMEALCEVLDSMHPLIVYFPDSSQWLSRAVSKSNRKEFVRSVKEMFDKLSGPAILICGQNKVESGSKEKEKFTMILPNAGRLAKLPLPYRLLSEGLKSMRTSDDNETYKLFTNVLCIPPPKEEDLQRIFNKQLEEDRKIVISRSNIHELHKVLEDNELSCVELLHVNSEGVILTKQKAEKVVGWAKNHHLSSSVQPSVKGERLYLPRESLEIAILRLKDQESTSRKPSQNLKNLAKDEYETNFVSAVVPPGEIGIKFDDVGALENVKKALNELVILPMRRPELFSRGNLLRPCKGILLFGPPGTGKTLLAKALATEAGANFISITGSTLTSKWFGDAEKLTKALFSFASKLAPVIIFVDEIDSLLGARGGAFEHEATRRMRNEFMAAWDGLRSKESQRILILGATNRPFDLDDAVIRRLPRRIYVDLPDAGNRKKILSIILAQENLESDFPFEQLANETDGYSGSDLKNLCTAAAYRPVQEILENENQDSKDGETQLLRPLSLDDFIQSKAKVGPSVAYDAASMNELRKWNEQYGEGGSRRKSPFGF